MTPGARGARIVVVGAGFAGLQLALRLGKGPRVTVVDPSPWFEFLPNIHELVSGLKAPGDLRLSRRELLGRAGHRFLQARVVEIDPDAREAITDGGQRLRHDVLAVAPGGEAATGGVSGADAHALPFRSVDDCAAIGERLRVLARGGHAGREVVIVGGGLEGVEALGEVLRAHGRALPVTLVESGRRLLAEAGVPALDGEIRARCAGLPVRVVTGTRVARVARDHVELAGGERLPAGATIWTGGARPPSLLDRARLSSAAARWAAVRPTLQSATHDHVFVLGDAADSPGGASKQAYHALDMGSHAAGNIERLLAGRRLRPFIPADKPMLVTLGHLDSYMIVGDVALAGPALGAAKEAVYQLVMSRLDARRGLAGLRGLARRSGKGLLDLARINLGSAPAAARSLNLRVIR